MQRKVANRKRSQSRGRSTRAQSTKRSRSKSTKRQARSKSQKRSQPLRQSRSRSTSRKNNVKFEPAANSTMIVTDNKKKLRQRNLPDFDVSVMEANEFIQRANKIQSARAKSRQRK